MVEAGFGFLQYFTNPNHCCVHDRVAETIVVREQAREQVWERSPESTRRQIPDRQQ